MHCVLVCYENGRHEQLAAAPITLWVSNAALRKMPLGACREAELAETFIAVRDEERVTCPYAISFPLF